MTLLKTVVAATSAAALALALSACDTTSSGGPRTGAQAEIDNASNIGSNGSAQPGGAGPSPNGGNSNPGTSGSVGPNPGPGPR